MLAPALFLWIVSTVGCLWWDPIVGFLVFFGAPLVLALALLPGWFGPVLSEAGMTTPRWIERFQAVPVRLARTLIWLWAIGWTFALPNPLLVWMWFVPLLRESFPVELVTQFTRWAMNHPWTALCLFFLSGWLAGTLWLMRTRRPTEGTILEPAGSPRDAGGP